MPRSRVVTAITCWAGREPCKAGVSAITGATGEERGAGTGITGLGRVTADGLGTTGNDRGPDNLAKGGATTGEMVDKHLACVVAASLTVPCADPRQGALVNTGTVGTLSNLAVGETRVDVPTGGNAKLLTCAVGNLGSADTTFVLLGNKFEPRPGVPVSFSDKTLGVVASNGGTTAGVLATKGELTAGTPGSLAGGWGKTGALGATMAWLAP